MQRAALFLLSALLGASALAQTLSPRAEQCIVSASQYHSVSADVMGAIVRHESRGRPNTVVSNSNKTYDLGLTGINSVHLPELRSVGVEEGDLYDECISINVGAWKFSKKVVKYGNTWEAVGAYHSENAFYSSRYQALIYNEMVNMGVLAGPKMYVPPLPKKKPPAPPASEVKR